MNPEADVLDAIDALVDEQLEQEASGYDHNINQPRCPHEGCPSEWHGLPNAFCPGSAVQGPLKPARTLFGVAPGDPWLIPSAPWLIQRSARWWRLDCTTHTELSMDHNPEDNTLAIRVGQGFDRYQGITQLLRDENYLYAQTQYEHDPSSPENDRLVSLDIYAVQPDDCNGQLAWREVDGPGGSYLPSWTVEVGDPS